MRSATDYNQTELLGCLADLEHPYVRRIFDTMSDGVVVATVDGKFVLFNGAAREIAGKGATDLEMQYWAEHYELYLPGGRELYRSTELPIPRALRGEEVREQEIWLRNRKATDCRTISVNAAPLRKESGDIEGAVAVFRDITEIVRSKGAIESHAKRLERSNELLDRFAYVISHDLQEPLRMVSIYLQLLKRHLDGNLDGTGEEYFHFAMDGAVRMKRLVEGVLSYSRVGKRRRQFEEVGLTEIVDEAVSMLVIPIRETGTVVTRGPLPVVFGDRAMLGQLFLNLIGNAIRFRGDRPPIVEIKAAEARDGEMCQVSVRDDGTGIAPEDQGRIFDIFERAKDSLKDGNQGSGIGLSVARRAVELHGGRIWVESKLGEGATFHFTLPLYRTR